MNIMQYMANPLGKGSSIMMIGTMKRTLDEEYERIQESIRCMWYAIEKKYFVTHVKIPSKSVDKLYYDVLIEIDVDSIPQASSVINGGNVRVFSNCPSFTYTYAYVFNQKGDLIPWTKSKYNHKIFELEPGKRNPMGIENYEKSLYFAIKYITSNGRNYKNKINYEVFRVHTHSQILTKITHADTVLTYYKSKKKKENERKLLEKSHKEKGKPSPSFSNKKTNNRVSSVKRTKKSSSVKKTKKI